MDTKTFIRAERLVGTPRSYWLWTTKFLGHQLDFPSSFIDYFWIVPKSCNRISITIGRDKDWWKGEQPSESYKMMSGGQHMDVIMFDDGDVELQAPLPGGTIMWEWIWVAFDSHRPRRRFESDYDAGYIYVHLDSLL